MEYHANRPRQLDWMSGSVISDEADPRASGTRPAPVGGAAMDHPMGSPNVEAYSLPSKSSM